MEIHIDLPKIVAEVLEKYPSSTPLKGKFEMELQEVFENFKEAIEDANQVGGLDELKVEYKGYYESTRDEYRRDWSKVNDFEGLKRDEAKWFIHFRFLESAMKWFNENVGEEGENNDMKKRGFTTARRVLAMHYLFEYNQVRGIDQTNKAKFIEFLTGNSYKNIYDLVRNPLSKKGEFRKADLKYIRTFFDDLEMRNIVKMIDNELDKPDQ
ncbi:MAG: hypothetical protein ABIO24_02040 [Saprospiraceae bacterium]